MTRAGRAGETCSHKTRCPPNGSDVKLRGQGPRGYGSAARRLPASELRDAGGVTPRKLRRARRLGRIGTNLRVPYPKSMNRRVDEREGIQYQWDYLLAVLGGEQRVTSLAYENGAFHRRRKIESPTDLLRLLLTWAVAERPLAETAALAAETGLADVSDVALLKRFSRAESWLGAILCYLLARHDVPAELGKQICLIDASSISCAGSKNTDRRIHLRMDLARGRTTDIDLTD